MKKPIGLEPIGFGYIVIPERVERENYVNTCYRKERVSIVNENGSGFIKECYIAKHLLNDITFPANSGILGNLVCWVSVKKHNKPTILAILSKESESQLLKEGKFQISRSVGESEVFISGSATDGTVNISVNSPNGGAINLSAIGKDALISVNSSGNVNVNAGGIVNITPTEKLNVFSGGSPMVLGDKMLAQLEAMNNNIETIIQAIKNGVPIAGDGGVGYQTSMGAIIDTQKKEVDFDGINSEKCFLD